MVLCLVAPRSCASLAQRLDLNYRPLSETVVEGTPNLATNPCTNARATESAVMLASGKTSGHGHQVNLSTQVRRYENPCEVVMDHVDDLKTSCRLFEGCKGKKVCLPTFVL